MKNVFLKVEIELTHFSGIGLIIPLSWFEIQQTKLNRTVFHEKVFGLIWYEWKYILDVGKIPHLQKDQ